MAVTSLASFAAFRPTNEELVALLPSLFAGAGSPFIHRADVLSAPPAVLVGSLTAAPGTDKGDGHGGVRYLLCPKKSKSEGDERRVRAVAGGGCWREDAKNKVGVVLGDGRRIAGCFRTFSYGYKTPPPARQFKRLGWRMVEYELEGEGHDHVLCKVYPSPRAKAAAASNSNSAAVLPSAAGDRAEAPPARLLSARHQVLEPAGLVHDAPTMMPVHVQHDVGQSSYFHEELQPCTFPLVTLPTHREGLDGYAVVAKVPQPAGAGTVLDDGTGFFNEGFFLFGGEGLAGIHPEELLNQPNQTATEYDQAAASPVAAGPPLDHHFFDGLQFGPY